ncbi:MAG: Uma2 family endonuclease [Hormoscilla sp. GM102CHS1]|nr:Uma2 family endonuclease [Hormoscilla sp. GM102CHS1]
MTNSTAIAPKLNAAFPQWLRATWEDYLTYRDVPTTEQVRRFFNRGYLLVDMGNEGINHSRFNHLFTMLFFAWFADRKPDQYVDVLGGCVLEKPQKQAASPDIVLYLGGGSPQWRSGEPRRINLDKWRVPDLVGEVGDTTIATDLGRVINHFFDRSRLIGYGVFRYPVITRWA